jgi:hypothetical protein
MAHFLFDSGSLFITTWTFLWYIFSKMCYPRLIICSQIAGSLWKTFCYICYWAKFCLVPGTHASGVNCNVETDGMTKWGRDSVCKTGEFCYSRGWRERTSLLPHLKIRQKYKGTSVLKVIPFYFFNFSKQCEHCKDKDNSGLSTW